MTDETVSALPDDRLVVTHEDLCLALGGDTTSFTGDLLRLIAKADPSNRHLLRAGFPRHVAIWEIWTLAESPLTVTQLVEQAEDMRRRYSIPRL